MEAVVPTTTTSTNHGISASALEREVLDQIVAMRIAGHMSVDIAYAMNLPTALIEEAIVSYLEPSTSSLQTLRLVELARCEKMHNAVWDKATAGQYQAIDRVIAIAKLRANLVPGLHFRDVDVQKDPETALAAMLGVSPEDLRAAAAENKSKASAVDISEK